MQDKRLSVSIILQQIYIFILLYTCKIKVLIGEEAGTHHHGQTHRQHCSHQTKLVCYIRNTDFFVDFAEKK